MHDDSFTKTADHHRLTVLEGQVDNLRMEMTKMAETFQSLMFIAKVSAGVASILLSGAIWFQSVVLDRIDHSQADAAQALTAIHTHMSASNAIHEAIWHEVQRNEQMIDKNRDRFLGKR